MMYKELCYKCSYIFICKGVGDWEGFFFFVWVFYYNIIYMFLEYELSGLN